MAHPRGHPSSTPCHPWGSKTINSDLKDSGSIFQLHLLASIVGVVKAVAVVSALPGSFQAEDVFSNPLDRGSLLLGEDEPLLSQS